MTRLFTIYCYLGIQALNPAIAQGAPVCRRILWTLFPRQVWRMEEAKAIKELRLKHQLRENIKSLGLDYRGWHDPDKVVETATRLVEIARSYPNRDTHDRHEMIMILEEVQEFLEAEYRERGHGPFKQSIEILSSATQAIDHPLHKVLTGMEHEQDLSLRQQKIMILKNILQNFDLPPTSCPHLKTSEASQVLTRILLDDIPSAYFRARWRINKDSIALITFESDLFGLDEELHAELVNLAQQILLRLRKFASSDGESMERRFARELLDSL